MARHAFTWLNKQGVQSKSGFVVQFTGRFSAEYREAGRVAEIYVHDGRLRDGLREVVVRPDAFDKWNGDRMEPPIPEQERKRLFANLRDAFAFQGLTLIIGQALTPKETADALKAALTERPSERQH